MSTCSDQPSRVRDICQLQGFRMAWCDRLFDKEVFPRRQRGKAERVMHARSAEQIDDIDIRAGNCRSRVAAVARKAEPLARRNCAIEPEVADFNEFELAGRAQFREYRQMEQ